MTPAPSPTATPGADAAFVLDLPPAWKVLSEDALGGADVPPGVTSALRRLESFVEVGGQAFDLPTRPEFVLAAFELESGEANPPTLSCNAIDRGSFPPDEALDGAEQGNVEAIRQLAGLRGSPEVDRIELAVGPTVRVRWTMAPPAGSGYPGDVTSVGYAWVTGPYIATCVFVASPATASADESGWQAIVATARARSAWSVSAVIPAGIKPFMVASGFGDIWVANSESGTVSRIDPDSNRVIATIDLRAGRTDGEREGPFGITVDATRVWVAVMAADQRGGTVPGFIAAIDPGTNAVGDVIGVGRLPFAIAAGAGGIWVANAEDQTVVRVDPIAGRVSATVDLDGTPTAIAAGPDAVWVLLSDPGALVRIDPGPAQVTATMEVEGAKAAVAVGDRGVWVSTEETLLLFDPDTGTVAASLPIAGIGGLATDQGSIWVAESLGNHVREIDEASATEVSVVRLNTNGWGIAVAAGAVWVVQPAAWDRKWAEAYPGVVVRIDR